MVNSWFAEMSVLCCSRGVRFVQIVNTVLTVLFLLLNPIKITALTNKCHINKQFISVRATCSIFMTVI